MWRAQRGVCVWLTGLSASGKSSIAWALASRLRAERVACAVLDGDEVRAGMSLDLGYSERDRQENVRRVSEAARLLKDQGLVVVCALISPRRTLRQVARAAVGAQDFLECHVDCPLEVCEARDPRGLYRRARAGELADFTGVSAPYEEPLVAGLVLDSSAQSAEELARLILEHLLRIGVLVCDPVDGAHG